MVYTLKELEKQIEEDNRKAQEEYFRRLRECDSISPEPCPYLGSCCDTCPMQNKRN